MFREPLQFFLDVWWNRRFCGNHMPNINRCVKEKSLCTF